jgi:hypothetical protein
VSGEVWPALGWNTVAAVLVLVAIWLREQRRS